MAQIKFARPDFRFRNQRVGDGMNTTPVLYYSTGSPFNNLMYQAEDQVRPDGANTDFDGTRDANGYPTSYGTATTWIGWYVWADIAGDVTAGDWVLTWEGGGNGSVKPYLTSIGSPTTDTAQRRVYNITDANFGLTVALRIDVADIDGFGTGNYAADPIRNVRLEPIALEGTCGYGEANLVRQKYIDAYKEFDYLRVMNLLASNQQDGNSSYLNRRPTSYRTFSHGKFDNGTGRHTPAGVPLEVTIEIVNQVGVRGWFCIPHEYDDASVQWFFETLRDNHNQALGHPMVEWSNEFWNSGSFVQGQWCQDEGLLHDASTRYITLGSLADPNFDGDYVRSNLGEVASGAFDTTNAEFRVFKRENGGTTYVLYHNQTSGNWEVATSTSDPDTWTNSQSVTLGTPETVTAVDDTWEDSTVGPDEDDANVTYVSRYNRDPFPLWYHGAFRSSQAMQIGSTVMDAAGLDWSAVLGVQTGQAAAQSDALDVNISEPYNSESTEKPRDWHTTVGVSFYVGNQAGRENFWSDSGAKSNATPVPGTALNTINWDPDVSKLYDYFDYMIDTFHPNSVEGDSWQSAKNRITTNDANWEIIGYEGNHHLVREFGGGVNPDGLAWWKTLVAEYETEAFSNRHRALLARWQSIFGSDASMAHFVLVDALDDEGHWAYYSTLDEAIAQQSDQTYRLAESMRNRCGHNVNLSL